MAVRRLDTLLALKAVSLAVGLKENDRRVAAALIEHFNRATGQCDPGLERIAGLLGLSTRTIIRSIHRLEAAGLFRKIRHGGHLNRNSYEPVWEKFQEIEAAWATRFSAKAQSTTTNLSRAPRQACHLQRDSAVTQTCRSNLLKETCLKRQAMEEKEGGLLRAANSTRASDAARAAAERRWTNAVHERFVSTPVTYGEVLELINAEMQAAATEAEVGRPGAGLAYILKRLRLPSMVSPANATGARRVGK
jgi:predicted transcriptional regulator